MSKEQQRRSYIPSTGDEYINHKSPDLTFKSLLNWKNLDLTFSYLLNSKKQSWFYLLKLLKSQKKTRFDLQIFSREKTSCSKISWKNPDVIFRHFLNKTELHVYNYFNALQCYYFILSLNVASFTFISSSYFFFC